ncbi:Y-family DNA polymerase [Nannocystis bainbridge]|uniref:DNA polymerase Y family protein n=1 Tax=Nannocystis bainbridge TaxID=2995303 RepID=A0ABT5E4M1_9BACT|nr:DNA polymerase Y family protein [Nannocystis bainbridge]MDC0719702.1 DNA polymerase Y family protein [Nannocystis bainbridge]
MARPSQPALHFQAPPASLGSARASAHVPEDSLALDPPARLACAHLPAFPLQVLLRRRPELRGAPVAVLRREGPQAEVLWANQAARRRGVARGMRCAAARGLVPDLHAEPVPEDMLDEAADELLRALLRRSPRVEPCLDPRGVFWLDPTGLERLQGDLPTWAGGLRSDLQALGYTAGVAVGFTRFHTLALARHGSLSAPLVLASPAEEAARVGAVPLAALDLAPVLQDTLEKLGISTLGGFLALPAADVRTRLGSAAAALHARASGREHAPLRPSQPDDPPELALEIDPPDDDRERLLFALKEPIACLLRQVCSGGDALVELRLTLELDHEDPAVTTVEPAAPLQAEPEDLLQLLDLLRLRLDGLTLAAPVKRVVLVGLGARARAEQLALLRGRGRDLAAAARALARVRAAFGEQAVTRASLRSAHLPEASFAWEPVSDVTCPIVHDLPANHHEALAAPPLCRRLLPRPVPLPRRDEADEHWLAASGLVRGAVVRMAGPYRISGGWWAREVERDYYFAETAHGDIAWLFYDRPRDRWYIHGILD